MNPVPAYTLISVIIPVFNGEAYLAEAIRSVRAQTYPHLELIVVNDGSSDQSGFLAQKMNVEVYLEQKKSGISAARNSGILAARGAFITFLDADDLFLPEKIAIQLNAFQNQPELDLVLGHVSQFLSPELEPSLRDRFKIPPHPVPGCLPSAVMVRKSSLDRVGLFETDWQVAEFMNWYLRALERGLKIQMLPDLLVHRRIHKTNHVVMERPSIHHEYIRALQRSIKRRDGISQ